MPFKLLIKLDSDPLLTMQVVPRASAVVPGAANAEPIVIHADHINMVKFASKEDSGYRAVSGHLQVMIHNADETIRTRWEMEKKVNAGMQS
jgi:hypothetical protein